MSKQEFLDLLDRYLAGKTSEEENDILLKVYQRMEERSGIKPEEDAALNNLEERMIQKFRAAIQKPQENTTDKLVPMGLYRRNRRLFNVAASLLLVATVGLGYYLLRKESSISSHVFGPTGDKEFCTYHNTGSDKVTVCFSDLSYAELEPGGQLTYQKVFKSRQRKVYLKGTAFFQVTKDHTKPFIVYTDRLVTKVLGTSFIVKSAGANAPASVTVVTGRVAVFNKAEFKEENAGADLKGGILLTPNHGAQLTADQKLIRKLADKPAVINTAQPVSFSFDNTPVAEVFQRLQKAYNIEIVFDSERLKNCVLSVDMGQEDFAHKLDVICHTLNLTYLTDNERVYISGQGCSN